MAFRGLSVLRIVRSVNIVRHNIMSTSILPSESKVIQPKKFRTETEFAYLGDPDTFGNLSGKSSIQNDTLEDEGDIKEQKYLEELPLPSQKLTTKQYADLIKQFIKHKRLKEAIDVLEVRMLTQDRAKPENYVYNILIGACADVGYTKKAFKLFNEMKRRGLKPTGDTYTCLFHACANSPWALDGLKNAKHLRELMLEKGIEPNITNYNSMVKAFGRCGDLATAFKIVDEMMAKKIKIRVHTLNHLLHACITDKEAGLRHALVVWRKMLKLREKPNIYTFNLMLKCVKECNLGSKTDIEELILIIQKEMPLSLDNQRTKNPLQIESAEVNYFAAHATNNNDSQSNIEGSIPNTDVRKPNVKYESNRQMHPSLNSDKDCMQLLTADNRNDLTVVPNTDVTLQFVEKLSSALPKHEERKVPNLLSKVIKMQNVLALQEVHTVQDKFAIIGGQEDFLKEMEAYSVKPDIKTFTQMLFALDDNREAETQLIESMKTHQIKADIDFYNMLIKKRCMRSDYDGAFDVRQLIEEEQKYRKKKYPLKKKLRLNANIMTYGVLALACKSKENAEKLLTEMKADQLKVNIEILGTLLRHGTSQRQFGYILYVMDIVKQENLKVNDVFLKHLEKFADSCMKFTQEVDKNGQQKCSENFKKAYNRFLSIYKNWLKEVNVEEALQPQHPWQQYRENYPETVQNQQIKIEEPKKFFKRNRKYVPYTPRL